MQKKLLKRSIMLLIILMLYLPCTTALTQEIPDNLVLEKPEILKVDNINKVMFSVEQYKIILQMYTAYQLYLDTKDNIKQVEEMHQETISICTDRLTLKNESIQVLTEERKFLYNTIDTIRDENKSNNRRNKIRTILIGTGSGLAGFGIGALVFLIAVH